jgi:hypothetical protein
MQETTTTSNTEKYVVLNGKNYCVEFRQDGSIKITGQRRQFDLSSRNNAISQYIEKWVRIDQFGNLGKRIIFEAQKVA